jgi:hypothetical protein
MKIRLSFTAIAFFILFLSGCAASSSSSSKLDTIFPLKIGQFNRGTANENSGSFSFAEYSKPYVKIQYGLDTEQTSGAVLEKVKRKDNCNENVGGKTTILKEDVLRDKTGKEIGNLLICREPGSGSPDIKGDIFKIILAKDKNYLRLVAELGGLSDLVEFAQAIPDNSQIDFTALKLDQLFAANPSTRYSLESLKTNPPLKLADKPYLTGKILIVEQVPYSFNGGMATPSILNIDGIFGTKNYERYGLSKDMMTESIAQAGTIIKVVCQKGKQIGFYVTKDAEKTKLPAYAVDCTVSIIDQSIPAIIAQKNYVGDFLMDTEAVTKIQKSTIEKEFFASPPYQKVADFLKTLSKK